MWQMVVNETRIRITNLHNDGNGMDICLNNIHLPNISFISLI